MISVIVYGRNDAHGYNLQKRAVISLNCIAEVLSHAEDEILFVDYNTPNDLPTFIEAIYDTLTARAKAVLKVFRVRPQLHASLVSGRTHLAALEPHARNIALRRSNPGNRWVLFTNTDMVFIPREGVANLTAAVEDLSDGLYILPRFGLPEPLWESFPRSAPRAILRACEEMGRNLHLDEVVISHSHMRFDAPGDFQLAPRQVLFDIRGFDERMIHGWHADSNLCKRLNLFYGGRTESLAHRLKGYHCDHTRVPTLTHRVDVKLQNDLDEFVNRVDHPLAPGQDETWGAPREAIEEVDFAEGPQARFSLAVQRTLGGPQEVEYESNAGDLRNFVHYHPEHALSYVLANLTTYPRDARFAYVGNNPRMLQLLARGVKEVGFTEPLRFAGDVLSAGTAGDVAEPVDIATVPSHHNLLIFDFGLDRTDLNLTAVRRVTDWPRELRYSLGRVARLLETCVEECEALSETSRNIPEFLFLNANHHVFRAFVEQFFVVTDTPYSTHVRKGWPRLGDQRLYRAPAWKYAEERMRSYFGYGEADSVRDSMDPPRLDVNRAIDLTSMAQSAAYKDGDWGLMDLTGTWTDGSHPSILFSPPVPDEDLLAYVRIVEACTGPGLEPIRIQALLEGEALAHWTVGNRYAISSFRVHLPGRLMGRKRICRLTLHILNPRSPQLQDPWSGHDAAEDPRELGVKVQRVTFAAPDRLNYRVGESIDFRDTGAGEIHLDEGWIQPDNYGTWTMGHLASLDLCLAEAVESPVYAVFTVTDAAISDQYPLMNVAVSINQHEAGSWKLGPRRESWELRILVPGDVLRAKNPVNISFRIEAPRSPGELQWTKGDTRPLGFRLTRVRLQPVNSRERKSRALSSFASMLLTPGGSGRPSRQEQLRSLITAGLRRLRVAMRGAQ